MGIYELWFIKDSFEKDSVKQNDTFSKKKKTIHRKATIIYYWCKKNINYSLLCTNSAVVGANVSSAAGPVACGAPDGCHLAGRIDARVGER